MGEVLPFLPFPHHVSHLSIYHNGNVELMSELGDSHLGQPPSVNHRTGRLNRALDSVLGRFCAPLSLLFVGPNRRLPNRGKVENAVSSLLVCLSVFSPHALLTTHGLLMAEEDHPKSLQTEYAEYGIHTPYVRSTADKTC